LSAQGRTPNPSGAGSFLSSQRLPIRTTRPGRPRLLVRSSLEGSAGAWDELLDMASLPSPFSRSWWLSAVARGSPRFLLVYDGAQLIGGLALEEHRAFDVSVFRAMGSGPLCPDHVDLLAMPGREVTVEQAVRAWVTRPGSRVFELDGVAARSRLPGLLPSARQTAEVVAPWTSLPSDPDAFLPARSANFRSNVRKAARRLARDGVAYRTVPASSVDDGLLTLRSLHAERWGSSPFLSAYDRFSAAARAGAGAGELSLHELVAGGTDTIASVACFEVAGRVSAYQGGRSLEQRWRGAGTVLLYEVIRSAAGRGFTEIDLLRGDEPYKANFATGERAILSVRASHGVPGHLLLAGHDAYRHARRAAGRTVRSTGRWFDVGAGEAR
jgi:CelD/BcsL family acetyltransferase involved in cellulose biosynthesis